MTKVTYDIVIICDGDSQYGFGHIRRSQTLFHDLKQNINDVALYGLSADARERLVGGSDYLPKAKVYLLDLPYATDQLANRLLNQAYVVGLDYQGDAPLSHGIYTFIHPNQRTIEPKSSGFSYCIIRPEFKALKPVTKGSNNVLVTIGGADINNQSVAISNHLQQLGAKVSLVLGPFASEEDLNVHTDIRLFKNPTHFPSLLNDSDWVVCNGGGTLFESRFLGKPCYVIPQTDAELRVANALAEKNELIGVGYTNLLSRRCLFPPDEFKTAPSCIDGLGSQRIQQILMDFLCLKNG